MEFATIMYYPPPPLPLYLIFWGILLLIILYYLIFQNKNGEVVKTNSKAKFERVFIAFIIIAGIGFAISNFYPYWYWLDWFYYDPFYFISQSSSILILLLPLIIYYVYNNNKNNSSNKLKKKSKGILDQNEFSHSYHHKPQTNNDSKTCSKCGILLKAGALFCHNCGKAINTEIRFCSYCGTYILKNSRFCHKCGNNLKDQNKFSKNVQTYSSVDIISESQQVNKKNSKSYYCPYCGNSFK